SAGTRKGSGPLPFGPPTLAVPALVLDKIRRHCALLLSEDFATHSAAYLGLRESGPFRRVPGRFREYGLNLFAGRPSRGPASFSKRQKPASSGSVHTSQME